MNEKDPVEKKYIIKDDQLNSLIKINHQLYQWILCINNTNKKLLDSNLILLYKIKHLKIYSKSN